MRIKNIHDKALKIIFPHAILAINPMTEIDLKNDLAFLGNAEQYIDHPKLLVLDSYPGFEEDDLIETRFEILDL